MTPDSAPSRFELLTLAIVTGLWASQVTGFVSSNDGSHVALARAFSRGRTSIDDDAALTLGIDLARRDGHFYSDRPPGTAFLAVPALMVGHMLDPVLEGASRSRQSLVVPPGSPAFVRTYASRTVADAPRPFLVSRLGTALASNVHALVVGWLGLFLVARRLTLMDFGVGIRACVVALLGLATLWGPYSTTLFSHGSAALCVAVVGLTRERLVSPKATSFPRSTAAAWLHGGAWGLAVACEYSLAVVALAGCIAVPRHARRVSLLGAGVPLLALGAYHFAAFGAPWRTGYAFHAHFAFARDVPGTFSGSLLRGLWTTWGAGLDAGVLVRAPVLLLAVVGLIGLARRRIERGIGSWLVPLAWIAWCVLIAKHRTPWGGEGLDHRYLIPLVPALAPGLAWLLESRGSKRPLASLAVGGLCLVAGLRSWARFGQWHETLPFSSPGIGAMTFIIACIAGWAVWRLWSKWERVTQPSRSAPSGGVAVS